MWCHLQYCIPDHYPWQLDHPWKLSSLKLKWIFLWFCVYIRRKVASIINMEFKFARGSGCLHLRGEAENWLLLHWIRVRGRAPRPSCWVNSPKLTWVYFYKKGNFNLIHFPSWRTICQILYRKYFPFARWIVGYFVHLKSVVVQGSSRKKTMQ